MNDVKVVLLTECQLPFDRIGSWPKMYDYLFENGSKLIDYIVCPQPKNTLHPLVKYYFVKTLPFERVLNKIFRVKNYSYKRQIRAILKDEQKLIIKIIDNTGLLNDIHDFLIQKQLRNRVRIIFFIHGYSYFFNNQTGMKFYSKIDHMVYLTNSSYKFELNRYHAIQCTASILSNGVDSNLFYKIGDNQIKMIKEELNLLNKKIILWIANERPKKGLNILLESWRNSQLNIHEDFVLIIIGSDMKKQEGNIFFLGKMPNNQLVKYYQIADFYLFTTLCHEGFPLSLTEAIKSGCTAIVSNIEPLSEVVQNGKFAYLVDNPNFISSWVEYLNLISENKLMKLDYCTEFLNDYLSIENWRFNIESILEKEIDFFSRF